MLSSWDWQQDLGVKFAQTGTPNPVTLRSILGQLPRNGQSLTDGCMRVTKGRHVFSMSPGSSDEGNVLVTCHCCIPRHRLFWMENQENKNSR